MMSQDDLFGLFSKLYDIEQETEMSLEDYLKCCPREPMVTAMAAHKCAAQSPRPSD
jgi:predicted Ser/Thr protein kinase